MSLGKLTAFLKKEFFVEISYRFAFFLQIFTIATRLFIFYFIDRLFGNHIVTQLKPYGVSYFPYVFLGLAFFSYIGTGAGSLANRIRNEQLTGTLEAILVTPTNIFTVVAAMGLWSFIWGAFSVVIYSLCGVLLFGVNLTYANVFSVLVILLLTAAAFGGLSLLAASFILIFKKGEPVTWVANTLMGIFGGVYFPIAILPDWMQFFSPLVPVTYAVRAIQLAVYKGLPVASLAGEICALLIFSVILLPLGILSIEGAARLAKKKGSLGHY
ncbi:MAG: ABC transporter permease [Candidatus Omnitrophota bacterium]